MVKICRCLANDKNREGLRTAAWNVLLRAHSMEKDERVLEALKVGQVSVNNHYLPAEDRCKKGMDTKLNPIKNF